MPKPVVRTTFNAKNKMKGPMKKMGKAVKGFAVVAGVALGAATLALKAFIGEASKIEDIEASFTPMLGSVEKAKDLVELLNQTAATTPFQLQDIANAATQLLPAMNGDLEETVRTFRMLGDTAGGNVEKLNRISSVYSRVLLKNKLETGDLNILTERGIPIYKELSESMGVTVAEMAKMASQGKITGADIEKVFQKMTSEGGVFFKGMEIASATLTGKISTLKDNLALTAATIGTQLLPTIKPLLDRAIKIAAATREWINNNKEMINQRVQDAFAKISLVVQTLIKWLRPLVELVIKIVKEMVHMFTETENGQKVIKLLAQAFKTIGSVVKIMWKIVKPILESLLTLLGPILDLITLILKGLEIVTNFKGFEGAGFSQADIASARESRLLGRNDNVVQSQSTVTNQSQLDVNFNNTPAGTSFNQKGQAPGIGLAYGYRQGNL